MSHGEFVKKSNILHNYKYDYSKVIYINSKTKVKIDCPIHGEFEQIPNTHLIKRGCIKCAGKHQPSTLEFISECNKIHNNFYNYELTVYKNNSSPIIITCPIHGNFEQISRNHLNGSGCKKCRILEGKTKRKTTEQFIKEATKIHSNKYDYSLVQYTGNRNKIKINCPKHGIFEQSPRNHLRPQGCPNCNNWISEKTIYDFLRNNLHDVKVLNQVKAKWLNGKINSQSYDIYLPKYNIAIEYQGIQHFTPVKWFGGESYFEYMTILDDRKMKLSIENNCKLLYFTYKSKDVPADYRYTVFTNEIELLNEIKNLINLKGD